MGCLPLSPTKQFSSIITVSPLPNLCQFERVGPSTCVSNHGFMLVACSTQVALEQGCNRCVASVYLDIDVE